MSHLKVFNYIAHRHVFDQLRRKLDEKSSHMILIAYHSIIGYRLFDLVSKQIVIRRDMVIVELKECDWRNNVKKDSMKIMYEQPSSEGEVQTQADTNRSQSVRNTLSILQDFVVTPNNMVNDKGEVLHYAFYANTCAVSVTKELHYPK